ncbi:MAG: LytR C-terminal domain-containing protein [Gemmatimonadaceae bacterium]
MKQLLLIAAAVLLLVVLAGAGMMIRSRDATKPVFATPRATDVPRAPDSVRIRVQVLNTTKTRGLARRATRLLRDRGFDVVEFGTASPTIDTTMVLDLSGHPAWAGAAAKVMAPATTRSRPDSSRYLDITVLVGSTWRPPAEPLYP